MIENFQPKTEPLFLSRAAALEPALTRRERCPAALVRVETGPHDAAAVQPDGAPAALAERTLHKGDRVDIDFGGHLVGYVSFVVAAVGSHYDAPAWLRVRFAELPGELLEDPNRYAGWLSSSWIQQESIHLDELPCTVRLPRRYAFRYLRIEVLDTSPKYGLSISNVRCESVSSAGEPPAPLDSGDDLLNRIDAAACKTLEECMQSVFEDGPKRDRRLWLGDLRLAALANYATFQNNDLVKRCLYLFAGSTFPDGRVGGCLFHREPPQVDDTYLVDFALLFGVALLEYYEASGDRQTLSELYPTAMAQIDLCLATMLDEDHLVIDHGDEFWCFVDWGVGLNKQCSAQGVLIYSIERGVRLAALMEDTKRAAALEQQLQILRKAARNAFWREEQGLFLSNGQVSWASQIWMVLAGVAGKEAGAGLLRRLPERTGAVKIVTPYLFHYYLEALLLCGEDALALAEMKRYWGGMLAQGADTFWEVYDPDDPRVSPYGSTMVNSYCHAWGCTPAWLLRKKFGRDRLCKDPPPRPRLNLRQHRTIPRTHLGGIFSVQFSPKILQYTKYSGDFWASLHKKSARRSAHSPLYGIALK